MAAKEWGSTRDVEDEVLQAGEVTRGVCGVVASEEGSQPPTPRAPPTTVAASPRPSRARTPAATRAPLVQDEQLRRSSRTRAPPNRFGYDGSQRSGYIASFAPFYAALRIPAPEIYRAVASNPDLLSFDQAMRDLPNVMRWVEAADLEVRTLERMGTWVEVPRSEATSRIIPGTWAFRRKRSPDPTRPWSPGPRSVSFSSLL